jgi:hypothetical protein
MNILLLKTGGVHKELRIEALVPRYANGGIYHLTYGGQNQCTELEDELKLFPKAANDDASDAAAYMLQMPLGRGHGEAGVVSTAPPRQQAQETFRVQNGMAVGGQVDIKRALMESEID